MKLQLTIKRLAARVDDSELRRAARDLGHELPRGRIGLLNQFRSAITTLGSADTFVKGYRAALADVTAAYQDAIEDQVSKIEFLRERLIELEAIDAKRSATKRLKPGVWWRYALKE